MAKGGKACLGIVYTTYATRFTPIHRVIELQVSRSCFAPNMTRQQGFKRARKQTKDDHKSVNMSGSDDENGNEGVLDDEEAHVVKKRVRWDNGTENSGVDRQDGSDDEPGGPQQVRYVKSNATYPLIHRAS